MQDSAHKKLLFLITIGGGCRTSTTDLTQGESGGNNRAVYMDKHERLRVEHSRGEAFLLIVLVLLDRCP